MRSDLDGFDIQALAEAPRSKLEEIILGAPNADPK